MADNSGTNVAPVIKESSNKKELSVQISDLTYRTTKNAKDFYINAKIKTGSPSTTIVKWTSSNTKVAKVDSNGKITPVGIGYSEIDVKLTRTDDKSLDAFACTTVVVFGDESPLIIKENLDSKGKSLSNDIKGDLYINGPSTFIQSFDIDEQTGDIYYITNTVSYYNKTIWCYRANGKIDKMELVDFGPGASITVERSGNNVYIWTDCSHSTAVARFKFQPGKTYTTSTGKVFTILGRWFGIDKKNRFVTVVRPGKYEIYSMDDLIKKGDDAMCIAEVTLPEKTGSGYQYQNVDICGRYVYTWWTVGNGAGVARSGDQYDCRLICVDAVTEKKVYESNLLATQGEVFSESEGLQVKSENGKPVIYANICLKGPVRCLIFKYAK